jgi:hypothetical protein
MAQLDIKLLHNFAAPMNKIASLLGQSPGKLVPFEAGAVNRALMSDTVSITPPSLQPSSGANATVSDLKK